MIQHNQNLELNWLEWSEMAIFGSLDDTLLRAEQHIPTRVTTIFKARFNEK
jgi:hypothetical protein